MQETQVIDKSSATPISEQPVQVDGRDPEKRLGLESGGDDMSTVRQRKLKTITSEDDEETVFQGEFTLEVWNESTSDWAEPTQGQLKLNDTLTAEEQTSRLIMRDVRTHELLLDEAIQDTSFRVISTTKTSFQISDGQTVWRVGGTNAKQLGDMVNERSKIFSWQPEPLVPRLPEESPKPYIITSKPGHMIEVDGTPCLNAGTHNYLNLADSPRLVEASLKAVRKYGVGSCGPRAFYGTMDVHLDLEKAIAKFLNVGEAVLYSFGFSTIASAIPAYIKAADTVLFDEQCNFALQKGITATRGRAIKFKHNNVEDLRNKLKQLVAENKKKELRLFLIIESIYAKTGTMCPLQDLIKVAREYKMRVFMDESRSFGVLGAEGKGITQHLNVDVAEIDLIMVSLEHALCSFGGFCAGSSFVIDHQRLAGSGYCFSASLPPFQCSAALEALAIIDEDPSLVRKAQEMFVYAQARLEKLTQLECHSDPLSPIKILIPKNRDLDLEAICKEILLNDRIAISPSRYLKEEEATEPPDSLRVIINASLSHADIDGIFEALERSSSHIGSSRIS